MRIHFAVATAVLVLAFTYGVTKLELMALLVAISFVLIAEMVNTAIEKTIDLAATSFDPLAKTAKDIAASAVLIASVNAVVIGYLVFADRLSRRAPPRRAAPRRPEQLDADRADPRHPDRDREQGADAAGDAALGRPSSGHAALAFGGFTAITFIVDDERSSSRSWP